MRASEHHVGVGGTRRPLQIPGATPLFQYLAFTGVKMEKINKIGQKLIWGQCFRLPIFKMLAPDEFLSDFNFFFDFDTSKGNRMD